MKTTSVNYDERAVIPCINLHVSVDKFYELLKNYSPSFGWELTLRPPDVTKLQSEVLDFLVAQFNKNNLGRVMICFSCTKIGVSKNKTVYLDKIKKADPGWVLLEYY